MWAPELVRCTYVQDPGDVEYLGKFFGIDWSALEAETKVALVALLGTVLLTAFGWAMSAINTSRTLKVQRRLAMEEKIWPRRAEVYVEVLEWAHGASEHIEESQDLPRLLQSKLAAYASPRVREAWDKIDTEMSGISGLRTLRSIDEGSAAVEDLAIIGNTDLRQQIVDSARQDVKRDGGLEKSFRNSYMRLYLRVRALEDEIREDLNGREKWSRARGWWFRWRLKIRGRYRKAKSYIDGLLGTANKGSK